MDYGQNVKSHCNINVRDFPYDEQICAMYLTSMVYSSSEGFSKWYLLEGAPVRAPISNGKDRAVGWKPNLVVKFEPRFKYMHTRTTIPNQEWELGNGYVIDIT